MITLVDQIQASLCDGVTTAEDVLTDIDQGTLSVLTLPDAHVSWRWVDMETFEVVTIFGDMALVRLLYSISREMGARKWTWKGRKGWSRVIDKLEAEYGRQSTSKH